MPAVVRFPGPEPTQDAFGLRLERVRLATLRALARARGESETVLDGQLEAVERALAAAPPGRDRLLARTLGLGPDELDFLWLAVALGSDPLLGPQAVALAGSEARRGATVSLLAALVDVPAARLRALGTALGPSHPLLRHGLLEPAGGDAVSPMAPFHAARRLVRWLDGDDELDEGLAAAGGRLPIPPSLKLSAAAEAARQRLAAALESGETVLVVIDGCEGAGRRTVAACAARDVGREAVVLDLERLAPTLAALEPALLALRREHLLSRALPVIAGLGDLTPERDGTSRRRAIERFVEDVAGPAVAVARSGDDELRPARPIVGIELPAPEPAARRALWRQALGPDAEPLAAEVDRLAMRHRLGGGEVAKVVTVARLAARARGATTPSPRELTDAVRAAIGQRLRGLAERVEVKGAWDDLILPADLRGQIADLVSRVKHAYQVLEGWRFRSIVARGGGVAALFTGAPGTGKTMAAGLVAQALELDLYQVDLSAVVSKWMGETEKNLSRIFDAADAGHALLLFDEADSLFAKRTEVRGSNDRHANLEVNHLLQRIEAFGGVAILTTNMDASLDPALRRRLAAKIDFWPPDEREREALWTRLLAGRAPLGADVDAARLARRFSALTGGTIRNAVVTAGFRAAAAGTAITQALLERAAADEYRAIGRIWMEATTP